MATVCLALIPGAIAEIYFLGWGVAINIFICATTAMLAEALVLRLRNKPISPSLKDYSALITGLLIALAIPPLLPWWMSVIGVSFAIVIAKHLYGGLGYNPFNPAMIGYVLLLVSFPTEMTAWLPAQSLTDNVPNIVESLELTFLGSTSQGFEVESFRLLADGFTMATPLDESKTSFSTGMMSSEILAQAQFQSNLEGWFWININFLAGGIGLLVLRVIHWYIPTALLLSLVFTSSLLNVYDNELFMPVSIQLFTGATMLGAFFIATDPVSAATTKKGRLIYGALIGFIIVIIRVFGGYPDAVAFAVLLLNIAVPTIDHYTKPRVYGTELSPDE
jgi:electron transport complex protein RnfD